MHARRIALVALAGTLTLLTTSTPGSAQQEPPGTPETAAAPETVAEPDPSAGPQAQPAARKARLRLRVGGISGGKVGVGEQVRIRGTLAPWVAGQKISIVIRRGKRTIEHRRMFVRRKGNRNYGRFSFSRRFVQPGKHRIRVIHKQTQELGTATKTAKPFRISYPSAGPGSSGSKVRLLKKLLEKIGYVPGGGSYYDDRMARAALAWRKVNGHSRTTSISSSMYRKIADGKGAFNVRYPGDGKHVEVDLSRQVMVLAKGDKVSRTYHVSTGAPATPTIQGHYTLNRREPGYNNKEMYFSTYFIGGYAIHGYKSVPTYPASHGCVRVPIPDAISIYNWIDLGDDIRVYP